MAIPSDELPDVEWDKMYASVRRFVGRLRGPGVARNGEDLVQDVMERLVDPSRAKWNPAEKSLADHAWWVTWGVASNSNRSAYFRYEMLRARVEEPEERRDAPPLDSQLDREKLRPMLEEQLEREPDLLSLLALVLEGEVGTRDLSFLLGRTPAQARAMRKRLMRRLKRFSRQAG